MRVGDGEHTYEWIDDWAKIPDTESARDGWAHHGVAVTAAGNIIASHPGTSELLEFNPNGDLLRSSPTGLTECHGICLVNEGGTEYLWIADTGSKQHKIETNGGYEYQPNANEPRVVKTTLDGKIVATIGRPDLPAYESGKYTPTWVAVNEERFGGNGDVWVGDGYGSSFVHRYDKSGNYIASINGEEGEAGPFASPHTIWIDSRKSEPELYIADRSNGRVQVYDVEGNYKKVFGSEWFRSPTGFATHGDLMVIIELHANIALVDADDNLVAQIGTNRAVCDVEGWPNVRNERGETIRNNLLEAGKLNSPHGVAMDDAGNIYVSEWLVGGRYTKLAKV